MHRATNLYQSCGHLVTSQGIGDVEIDVKIYARPELWENKGYVAGYSAAQIDNLVNVITQTRGELPMADFGCGGVNWGLALMIYHVGITRQRAAQTPDLRRQIEDNRRAQLLVE